MLTQANPNTRALAEIAKMPSLAGQPPRSAFQPNQVVMADLERKPAKEVTLYERDWNK